MKSLKQIKILKRGGEGRLHKEPVAAYLYLWDSKDFQPNNSHLFSCLTKISTHSMFVYTVYKLPWKNPGMTVNHGMWDFTVSHSSFWVPVLLQASGSANFGPFPWNILLDWFHPDRIYYLWLR